MGLGSGIQDPEKTYSGSRIQGSKRHRIPDPDPQHCLAGTGTVVLGRIACQIVECFKRFVTRKCMYRKLCCALFLLYPTTATQTPQGIYGSA
jgi:hypothetical protein